MGRPSFTTSLDVVRCSIVIDYYLCLRLFCGLVAYIYKRLYLIVLGGVSHFKPVVENSFQRSDIARRCFDT